MFYWFSLVGGLAVFNDFAVSSSSGPAKHAGRSITARASGS